SLLRWLRKAAVGSRSTIASPFPAKDSSAAARELRRTSAVASRAPPACRPARASSRYYALPPPSCPFALLATWQQHWVPHLRDVFVFVAKVGYLGLAATLGAPPSRRI